MTDKLQPVLDDKNPLKNALAALQGVKKDIISHDMRDLESKTIDDVALGEVLSLETREKCVKAIDELKTLMETHVLVEVGREDIKKALYIAWHTNSPKTFGEAMEYATDEIVSLLNPPAPSKGGE